MKTFEITLLDEFGDAVESETIFAKSRSQAKYFYFQAHEWFCDFKGYLINFHKCHKIRTIGETKLVDRFTKDIEGFERMKKSRNIEFAELGMKIDVNGKIGNIVGYNSSCNLDVYFPDEWVQNCHPYWETTYFDKNKKVIKCYKEKKDAKV